ncbi:MULTISPECIES: tail fiber assembly protein [Pseudomonas]|uniref:tail fiber assembly protein n=1 Tax=Pseudomonas TaxID=286 RepID=UPI000B353426|nr:MULTISPECIES: tail fiber assembly protein [Pseudomonas]PMY60181.1 hypothetical protein C1Y32_31685 [Pseudomonas sp. FW126-L8]PMY62068.1 hypothetical protein C1Y31_23030 [Pseudomonas sp. FW305-25]PNA76513.1 hypothetical protein C1Y33_19765 [Pseudomonas sp. FW305-76]
MWALIIDEVVVEVTDIDPAGRFHPDLIWTSCPKTVLPGWTYDGDGYKAPEIDPSALAATAIARRDGLLRESATRVAPLQDAVDLGEATTAEREALISWKSYRINLNRIEHQAGFPTTIDWPSVPGAQAPG